MPTYKKLSHGEFFDAVTELKDHPETYNALTFPQAGAALSAKLGVNIPLSTLPSLFEKSGVERVIRVVRRESKDSVTRLAAAIVRMIERIGIDTKDIDAVLLELAGITTPDAAETEEEK